MAVGSTVTADPAESVHALFHFLQQGELLTPPLPVPVPAEQLVRASWGAIPPLPGSGEGFPVLISSHRM